MYCATTILLGVLAVASSSVDLAQAVGEKRTSLRADHAGNFADSSSESALIKDGDESTGSTRENMRDSKGCSDYTGCNECTRAGCFWQTVSGCNSQCVLMDTRCFGVAEHWTAYCPLPGDHENDDSPFDRNTNIDSESFLVDDDQDCCDEQPRCPKGLQASTTEVCTQAEFQMDLCIIERLCCNQVYCRVQDDLQGVSQKEDSSLVFIALGFAFLCYVLSLRRGGGMKK